LPNPEITKTTAYIRVFSGNLPGSKLTDLSALEVNKKTWEI